MGPSLPFSRQKDSLCPAAFTPLPWTLNAVGIWGLSPGSNVDLIFAL